MNPKHPKTSIWIRFIAAQTCLAFFAGCAQIAVVSEKRPAALPPGSGANRVATQTIDSGLAEEKKQPTVALGAFVAAARDSLHQLDRNPANAEARRDYNFAVARIFSVVRDARLDPWTQPMRVGANGEYSLTWKRDPLGADLPASYATLLAREKPQQLALARMLRPQEYAATARVARLEPYNPNKTVLLVIHGLMDTPATWVPMLNDLRGDKDMRRNYQFWFYSYPSGYPYPYSAAILRQELDAIEKKFPLRKPMVVVAHSMGGSISHTLLTDAGTTLWLEAFGHPPAQTPMDPKSKHLLEEVLIFEHRRDIGRVVFMSTPHRGSDLASNWIGRIGSMLVKTPSKLLNVGRTTRELLTADPAALKLKRLPNSVDTLAPNNRFVMAINKIPMTKTIPYHSIIGDRGRGDTPNSSDGVVAYWSSHLDRKSTR